MSAGRLAARTSRWWPILVALALPACDEDPSAVDPVCTQLPELRLDRAETGTLSRSDPRHRDAPIDFYALRLDRARTVVVVGESAAFDPLLLLFHDDGRVLAQGFQEVGAPPGSIETAELLVSQRPGCWVIGVSAWRARDERRPAGPYSVRVADP